MTQTPHNSTGNDPLHPHSHDPNPEPPSADPTFQFIGPGGASQPIALADLRALPQTVLPDCYIVSTGHGTSGPFTFAGPTLWALIKSVGMDSGGWKSVEVISADGFGTRVDAAELQSEAPSETILLAVTMDGQPMTREQGVVRLIVPSERDDALRQVKWIGVVRLR